MTTQTEFEVDGWNNFCRVFEMPTDYPSDYCFGGGHPVNFQLVDWFYPVSQEKVPIAGVSKRIWRKEVGEIKTLTVTLDELSNELIPLLQDKRYVKPGREYIVLTDFGASIRFESS